MNLQGGKGPQYETNKLKVTGPNLTPRQIKAIQDSPKGQLPVFLKKVEKVVGTPGRVTGRVLRQVRNKMR